MFRAVGALLLAVGVVTCRDQAEGPSPMLGSVAVSPVFPSGGSFVGGNLPIDHVHAVVVRPSDPTPPLKDVVVPFNLNADQLQLKLQSLQLESAAESLDVTIELLSGSTVLFSGTMRVEAQSGPTPPPAPLLPLTFVGPGSSLTALFLAPLDSSLTQGDNLPMRVTGEDANQIPVTSFYVSWSTSDTNVARVNGDGRVTGKVPRGMVYVRARTPATITAPAGVVESTTVTLVPLPASLVKVGGDNQSAPVGSALPLPLAVEVRAADNLPVPGAIVIFAVATGGGSVDSASATSDAAGVARSGATVGGTLGANTFTASAAGAGSVTFTATATLAPTPTWTGTASNDWSTAANWSTNAVPTATDNVIIPNVANDPIIGVGGLAVNNMTVAAGAVVGMAQGFSFTVNGSFTLSGTYSCINCNLTVLGPIVTLAGSTLSPSVLVAQGSLTVGGTFGVGSMNFNGINQAIPAGLPYQSVAIAGSALLTGRTTISSGIDIYGSGSLALSGHTLVAGLFQVGQGFGETSSFTMSSSLDSIIAVNVLLQGGSTAGKLTAGVIVATGNFTQQSLSSPLAFSASGSHKVVLSGAGVQNVSLQTSSAANSHFQDLEVSNAVAVSFLKDATVNGQLISQTGGNFPIVQGTGTTLTVAGTSVNALIVDTIPLVIGGGTISAFDEVVFSNTSPTATAVTIAHPGAAAPFVFTDLVFQVTPTTGKYLDVTDTQNDANVLTINMVTPTPGTPGGFVQTAGGAVVNWPSIAPGPRAWTGASDTDWNNAANWNPAIVPTAGDQVTIGPATNQPTLTANSAASSIIVAGLGARLTIAGQTLTVGSLTTHTDGLLVMTNPADLVIVTGDAAFQGGDETGLLSAGELRVAGGFIQQDQTNTKSFFASGTHRTVMNGTALQEVTFCCTAAASGFRELDLSNSVGINIQFSGNNVFVYDSLISQVGAGPAPLLYTLGRTLTAARLRVDKLIVDRGTLILNEGGVPATEQLDNVTFQNFLTTFTQLSIVAPGGAPRNLTFNNLTFQPLVAGNTGRYISVTAPSGTLVVDLPGASPGAGGNGPAFTTTSGAVTVNWPAPAPGRTWNGSVSTNWSTAGNWTPAAVPTNADDVTIPATANNPLVTTSCSAKSLTVNVGAVLNLNGFNCQVQGDVFADGSINTPGSVQMQGTGLLRGNLSSLIASAAVTLNGAVQVGATTVTGGSGLLTLGGQQMTVSGNFTVQGGALLDMTNGADVLTVTGVALFNGADETGRLTAGLLDLTGGLTQFNTTSASSFRATGTHRTRISGGLSPILQFQNPGTSQFNVLEIATSAGSVNLNSDVLAQDQLVATPPSTFPTIAGAGHTLTVAGFNVTGLNLNNVLLNSVRGTMTAFSNVTFNGYAATATQLSVSHDGTAAPFVFDQLTFNTVPTTGFYLSAVDLAPANGFPLTINVTNSTPASGAPFVQTAGGAVVNWPFGGASITWTGTTSTDWSTASNWSPAVVPTSGDNVVIPSGTPFSPTIVSVSPTILGITVQSGASLNLGAHALTVLGNIDALGTISNGSIFANGSGKTARGTMPTVAATIDGTYTLSGATTFSNITVDLTGRLTMNGNRLTSASGFNTAQSGVLVMNQSLDTLVIAQNITFGGGDETGLLTAGGVLAAGQFTQISTNSTRSFAASGTLGVGFVGAGSQTINFQSAGPGLSGFADLGIGNSAGGVTLASDIYIQGQTVVLGAAPRIVHGQGHTISFGGLLQVNSFTFDNALVNSTNGIIAQFDNVTFQNYATTATVMTIAQTGGPSPITFNNTVFQVTPTTGAYLDVTDNVADANVLTIDMVNPTPGVPGSFVRTAGGAVVNWPFGGAGVTWTGATSTDWDVGSNWTGGVVPGFTDNAIVPAGPTNQPTISSAADGVNDLTVQSGATLTIGPSAGLVANGNVDASGTIASSTGLIVLSGTGKTMMGNLPNVTVSGTYSLAGNAVLGSGNVLTVASGSLTLNGHSLTTSDFLTNVTGILVMTAATDSLIVSGVTAFDGGNEAGSLTAGVIVAQGDFVQNAGSNAASFAASPGHKVAFTGPASHFVTMVTPGTGSQFGSLQVAGTGAVFVGSNALVSAGGITVTQGSIDPTGFTLTDLGSFATSGTGTLTMTGVNDSVLVSGAATFGGGDETGLLTEGFLSIGGSFGQNNSGGSTTSFAASGNHTTRIGAAAARVINFGTPSQFATGSHFANLDVTPGTGGITFANGNNFANGQLISTPVGAAPTLTGGVLTVHQLNVTAAATSLILDNVRVTLIEQSAVPEVFDHVQFINFGTLNNQLDINAFGAALTTRSLSFGNLVFSPLSGPATAVYVKLTSINGLGLTLSLPASNESPGTGGNGPSFSNPPNQTTVGGATILWP